MTKIALRVASAQTALAAFVAVVGDMGDEQDNVTDLLANLMHLCDAKGLDFATSLRRAESHFDDESDIEAGPTGNRVDALDCANGFHNFDYENHGPSCTVCGYVE